MTDLDLTAGDLELRGRVPWSSNATFIAELVGGSSSPGDGEPKRTVVYKPERGESPLWDFPEGTLHRREQAAFELSEELGWKIVPATVIREGPHGPGMVQDFVDHDPDDHYFTLLEARPQRFRCFAAFDVLVNNADRKGGHCLRGRDGHIWGIDHGLTFHTDDKLRTVIWDFADEEIPPDLVDDVCRLVGDFDAVVARLRRLLDTDEIDALLARCEALVATRRFPVPDAGYHSVPWPLV